MCTACLISGIFKLEIVLSNWLQCQSKDDAIILHWLAFFRNSLRSAVCSIGPTSLLKNLHILVRLRPHQCSRGGPVDLCTDDQSLCSSPTWFQRNFMISVGFLLDNKVYTFWEGQISKLSIGLIH